MSILFTPNCKFWINLYDKTKICSHNFVLHLYLNILPENKILVLIILWFYKSFWTIFYPKGLIRIKLRSNPLNYSEHLIKNRGSFYSYSTNSFIASHDGWLKMRSKDCKRITWKRACFHERIYFFTNYFFERVSNHVEISYVEKWRNIIYHHNCIENWNS